MTSTTKPTASRRAFRSDADRWQAVVERNPEADGTFYFAVKTTGVYCRPSCAARRPRRENVLFYRTANDAERDGFRACKRCRPNDTSVDRNHAAAITTACAMIADAAEPPSLNELANAVHLSPSHFHRLFKAHTGLTPKAYAAAQRSKRVRTALTQNASVTSAMYDAGFNSNGRFYATSSKMLGMTPTDFRTGGGGATIRFAVGQCSLGSILVAASAVGICAISLGDDPDTLVRELQDQFPKADFVGGDVEFERTVAKVIAFVERPNVGLDLPLDIQGTAFQQRVWQALTQIPAGQTRTYVQVARSLGKPTATRAVAAACAANKIGVAIPCHRVVRTDGSLSGYRWGIDRKAKLLAAER